MFKNTKIIFCRNEKLWRIFEQQFYSKFKN